MNVTRVGFVCSFPAGVNRQRHQFRHTFAQLFEFLLQARLDLVKRQAGVMLVEKIARLDQF